MLDKTELSSALAAFTTGLEFENLDKAVIEATKELYLDWLGSALAGRDARPVNAFINFASEMGPDQGPSLVLTTRASTSPLFAALVNAASSHVVEQDDLHNSSVLHPATVVFPPALAAAQALQCDAKAFISAAIAGYEIGVRVGEYLGLSHYKVFHMTGTAGTLAASAATARILNLNEEQTANALGSAGTQAAGLWEFLRDAADSKQLHTAKAAADGLLSAYTARQGLTGAKRILEGEQGMAKGMLGEANVDRLLNDLGKRWAVLETSYKYHASCRHTHPAADALLHLVKKHQIQMDKIKSVRANVYQAALDVLGPVNNPQTIHQAKFCMGFVLALIAQRQSAGVNDFNDKTLTDGHLRNLCARVETIVDPEIDAKYPEIWSSRVEVETVTGEVFSKTVEVPKGDPDNPLSRAELETKFQQLACFNQGASSEETDKLIEHAWNLEKCGNMRTEFPLGPHA